MTAVRTVAVALDDVAYEAMQSLLTTLEQGPAPLTPDGAIDLAALRRLAPPMRAADSANPAEVSTSNCS